MSVIEAPRPNGFVIDGVAAVHNKTKPIIEAVNTCLPVDQDYPTFTNHKAIPKPPNYVPSYGFFMQTEASRALIGKVLTKDGRWIHPSYPYVNPYAESVSVREMMSKAKYAIQLSNESLRVARPGGVNDHSEPHIYFVVEHAGNLLDMGKYNAEVKRNAEIAGIFHDTGCTFSREGHAFLGPRIAERVFAQLKRDKRRWGEISRAMNWHDSTALSPFVDYMIEKGLSADEIVDNLRKVMGPAGAALYIADKLDVRSHRVIINKRDKNVIRLVKNDPHKLLNLLLQTDGYGFTVDEETGATAFEWKLILDPYLPAESVHRHAPLVDAKREERTKGKVPLVPEIANIINVDPYDALVKIGRGFEDLYGRTKEMPFVVRALFPDIDEFKISITVATDKKEKKDMFVYKVKRDGQVMDYIKRNGNNIAKKIA